MQVLCVAAVGCSSLAELMKRLGRVMPHDMPTLLHAAARSGSISMATLLLDLDKHGQAPHSTPSCRLSLSMAASVRLLTNCQSRRIALHLSPSFGIPMRTPAKPLKVYHSAPGKLTLASVWCQPVEAMKQLCKSAGVVLPERRCRMLQAHVGFDQGRCLRPDALASGGPAW